MKTTNLHKLTLALTVPALAGLLLASGCDDKTATPTTPAGSTDAGTDMSRAADDAVDATGNAVDNAADRTGTAMNNAGDAMTTGANNTTGMMGNDSPALKNVPDATIEKLTGMSQRAAEMAEKYKDQAEDNTDIPGYGTGGPASQKLGQVNEAFDALKGGIEDRNMAEVTNAVTKLKGMNLQGELKTQFDSILSAMKTANIPGIGM